MPALSRVGRLGAWAFGGVGWGPQDDRGLDRDDPPRRRRGVSWIDTAAVYGDGHAERIVGEALAGMPAAERPLVFTKAGVLVDPDTGKTHRDLSPASLRAECEGSLQRLGIERIDLYQLHWPVEDVEVVEAAWAHARRAARGGQDPLGRGQQLRPRPARALRARSGRSTPPSCRSRCSKTRSRAPSCPGWPSAA